MIKVEVIEKFTLKAFNELKNIQRKAIDVKGTLFVGDIFECDEEMVKYLSGDNAFKKAYVRVIEVLPKEELKKVASMYVTNEEMLGFEEPKKEEKVEEVVKPKKKKTSKK